jgi:hypothetical protein
MSTKYAFRQHFGQIVPAGGRHWLRVSLRVKIWGRTNLTPVLPLSLKGEGENIEKRSFHPS